MKKYILFVLAVISTISLSGQNVPRLVLDAAANQTNANPFILLRNSVGSELMRIHSDHPTNTFVGWGTGIGNNPSNVIDGVFNTFIGSTAGYFHTIGFENTAVGNSALYSMQSGDENTAVGSRAMYANSTGRFNTAIGNQSLGSTTASEFNTALGYQAGAYYNNGWNNTFLGAQASVNQPGLYNVVAIGQGTVVGGVSQAILGNSSTTTCGGYANWSNVSDGRYKRNVNANVPGLDFILKLRPVTYNLDITGLSKAIGENNGQEWNEQMKKAISDKEKMLQTGFIAQEVEAVAQSIGFDFSGVDAPENDKDKYGLRYAEFVVPLVKAVQELNQQVSNLTNENELLVQRLSKIESLLSLNERDHSTSVTHNQNQ